MREACNIFVNGTDIYECVQFGVDPKKESGSSEFKWGSLRGLLGLGGGTVYALLSAILVI